jgi:hypothetical protein
MRRLFVCLLALSPASQAIAQTTGDTLPPRRPGQWEIRMQLEGRDGGPEMLARVCTDVETEKLLMAHAMGGMGASCRRNDVRRAGDTYRIETDCDMGGMRTQSVAVASGDFQSGYTMRIEGSVTMAGAPPQKTLMVQQARWLGAACTAGMVPGDMEMSGQRFNVRSLPRFSN